MSLKFALSSIFLAGLLVVTAHAAEPLQPRAEVSVKGGTDRSLLTTEFWAPLVQQSDRVLYGDIRLMGDNDENREGNLGVGYRQVVDDYVVGTHGWIDRRRTQNNSTFHQLTFGVERLGHIVDARANIYVPLNGTRSVTTPNIGAANPYLAGNGIFYDTNGAIVETPQYGIDGEVGYRIPVFQKQVDALRVLGGGYHFFREDTDNVTGIRLRTEAQVNKAISVGARFQYDEPRGSQGFLEATLKFPFSAKKLYQTDYLRSRLDESPERDVDIVTDSKVDTGLRKEIISTTSGQRQRVINVDNSNTNAGDGTKENPFNTLKAAEAILQDNDIIYVNHGTGTTTGMDNGINITKANVSLIGSGSDFVYDAGKFAAANGTNYSGTLLQAATAAPIITNSTLLVTTSDHTASNGIFVTGDNTYISGLTVSGANHNGINVMSSGIGNIINNITIDNVTVETSARRGILIYALDGGEIGTVSITNSRSNGNLNAFVNNGRGIEIRSEGANSSISKAIITGNTLIGNASPNISISVQTGTYIGDILIDGNTSTSSGISTGINVSASGTGQFDNVTISNNVSTGNFANGIGVATNAANTNSIIIKDNVSNNNTLNGISVATSGTGIVNQIMLENNTTNGNTAYGQQINLAGSTVHNLSVVNTTANGNTLHGLYVVAGGATKINAFNIANNSFSNNTQHGLYMYSVNTTSVINNATLSGNDIIGNGQNGIYLQKATGATLNADLGGGAFGSIGQNNISGNTGNDVRLNYAGGGAVIARNNYWGGGALTRVTLTTATIDSTAFLTTAP